MWYIHINDPHYTILLILLYKVINNYLNENVIPMKEYQPFILRLENVFPSFTGITRIIYVQVPQVWKYYFVVLWCSTSVLSFCCIPTRKGHVKHRIFRDKIKDVVLHNFMVCLQICTSFRTAVKINTIDCNEMSLLACCTESIQIMNCSKHVLLLWNEQKQLVVNFILLP